MQGIDHESIGGHAPRDTDEIVIDDAAARADLPRIALYGTFDVLNFGDLLFPHLLRHGLGPSDHEIAAFSPVGGRLKWDQTVVAQPVQTAVEFGADLHVIGGGNIIHAGTTTLSDYHAAGIDPRHVYASLWLGAGLIAAQSNRTLVWNAPGVPAPVEGEGIAALRDDILAASTYVSVRDRASLKFLGAPDTVRTAVVPDTALDIGRVWPAATLLDDARRAFIERGAAVPESWIVFHVNSRYLDGDATHHAALIEAIAAAFDAVPVLVAFGPCHGDDLLARDVGALLRVPALVVDRPSGLKEIAALLAFSAGYVGSSLHGLITALSYARPAIAVANRHMVKFTGFLAHLAMPDRLADTWSEAQALAARLLQPLDAAALAAIARAQDQIALHWAWLRASLGAEPPRSVILARTRLQRWMAEGTTGCNDWRSFETLVDGVPQLLAPTGTVDQPPPVTTPAVASPVLVPCNICGKTGFRPNATPLHDQVGFGARCAACAAPARHRAMRVVLDWWRGPHTKRQRCLRLGMNRVVAAGWFASLHDIDVEGGKPVQVSELACLAKTADIVVCIDVLERVPDLHATLRALLDALRPGGLLFLAFRNLPGRTLTLDWGFPRGDLDNEYRKFGTDVLATLRIAWPDAAIAVATPADPLTGIRTMVYVLAQTADDLRWLRISYLPCEIDMPNQESQALADAK
jgi:polysaccharide pyruvyl transferase WcaK-like protein